MRESAMGGALVWAALAVLARVGTARIGSIELLFLFAVLVIVPLAMQLGREISGPTALHDIARKLQPFAAALAVWAMLLPPGRNAVLLALAWLAICFLMALDGLLRIARLVRHPRDSGPAFISAIAQLDLAVGALWLVSSRYGLRPMGIQEPIGLLTAVHFHFAGFATATIAAATLQFAQRTADQTWFTQTWLRRLVLLVALMPIVVAAGFVISPFVKMTAATLFSASVAALAVCLHSYARKAEDSTARILLQLAAVAIFAGMVLSSIYAVADFLHSDVLPIPQMARTHGLLNAVGFCLLGVMGWLVEGSTELRVPATLHDDVSQ